MSSQSSESRESRGSRESRESREPRSQRRFIKKPDTKARDEISDKLKAKIKQKDITLTEINAQLNKAVTDPKVSEERKELIGELSKLKKTQAELKDKRSIINDKIKEVDAALKRKVSDIQSTTSKYNFKSAQDIDSRIAKYEDEISSGNLKLVEERRLVKEISNLRKLRKDFEGLSSTQKSIDNDKERIGALKKELSALNSKEISQKFEEIQAKLDKLNLDNKSVNDKRTALFNKRNALNKEKDVLYAGLKAAREEHDQKYKQFLKAVADEKKRFAEEESKLKAEKEKAERSTKTSAILEEASKPAFEREIDTIHTLLTVFDPAHVKPVKKTTNSDLNKSGVIGKKTGGRVVEKISEDLIIKKEDTAFFAGTKVEKKKNSKNNKNKKFTLEPDVISSLGDLGIVLPLSQDDVPKTIESLQSKLEQYTSTQEETTKKNTEAAKTKIAELEAKWAKQDAKEAEELAKKSSTATDETNKENVDQE